MEKLKKQSESNGDVRSMLTKRSGSIRGTRNGDWFR